VKSVSIVLNPQKTDAIVLARELVPWLHEQNVLVSIEHDGAVAMGAGDLSRDEAELVRADFAIVMGGDGTLLRASRIMTPAGVPMLPLRFGELGFMTDIEPADAQSAIVQVLDGHFSLDERMTLVASVHRGKEIIGTSTALNDMVIAKGPLARMLRLPTSVSGQYVSTYAADGLIIATPTGSTAYSLSAGGPLVTPDLAVIILTPICPHTLTVRSLIISSKDTVELSVDRHGGEVVLTVDGQRGIALEPDDRVVISESKYKAKLISLGGNNFYEKLRTRLRWGNRFDCGV
jgi:NAD+ kinase